ncbi:zinc finger protein [Sesbania bispinosa]|nr:zinc finger protein [Sesbania bispinosa]
MSSLGFIGHAPKSKFLEILPSSSGGFTELGSNRENKQPWKGRGAKDGGQQGSDGATPTDEDTRRRRQLEGVSDNENNDTEMAASGGGGLTVEGVVATATEEEVHAREQR